MIDPELIALAAAVVAGTPSAAYAASRRGTKDAFNGIYKRFDRHETKLDKVVDSVADIRSELGERVAKLEGKHE